MEYDGLIFDLDGVLLEYEPFRGTDIDAVRDHRPAYRDAADELQELYGLEDDHVPELFGYIDMESIAEIADEVGTDRGTLWESREQAVARAKGEEARSGRELYDDVDAVRDIIRDETSAVVSNSQHGFVTDLPQTYPLFSGFDALYGKAETLEGFWRQKPEPDYIEEAMDETGLEDPLFIGDSDFDVEAARRAGIDVAYLDREGDGGAPATAADHHITELAEVVNLYKSGKPS